ncbi:DEHA2E13508p [Debaryomyces hansenii CBS767]|uniref:DEHA2E13508p n=1 Tax=Debaryomyces hansenii (strain ATCC 36239 / CBS 767 / BCRC 21394 / JCM 1990 / NBRC 0083 / IGC 2968) TaxID=284592 RepID=B5RU07_DEBHA|nr:DEHA2E13508p [Debaryomyces hansenii CBS767]CAR65819.1 DEHA2E13508p [Debaryomyces hansenii CBS767]|eukprot:XP_002770476.1 DEHA2E13508p [Debaryomyces hansenii CBS767]
MISNKKIRLVAISALSILFIILFFRTSSESEIRPETLNNDSKAQTLLTANNLIDSKNDDKVDAAINNEISKLNNDESEQDTSSEKAQEDQSEKTEEGFDAAKALLEIRAMSPMVIFSKTYCPYSKRLKQLLRDNYQITPEPTIMELDKHGYGQNLQEYLEETTGRGTVPNVLVGTSLESRGGFDDIKKLHDEGKLLTLLVEWGSTDSKKLDVKKIEAPSNS